MSGHLLELSGTLTRIALASAGAALRMATACRAPRPSTEVAAAIVEKDQESLARLLAAGRSPEEGSPRPIVWAARSGNSPAIALLVAAGADPNRPDGSNH